MLTNNDIVDIIVEVLGALDGKKNGAAGLPPSPAPVRRVFISEWELKRLYKRGDKIIAVPGGAIISPLAQDWLDFENIEIRRG